MTAKLPQWEAYINWLVLDPGQKERLNLPKNQTEYAIANNISDRQLRRWKLDPVFTALHEKKLASLNKPGLSALKADETPTVQEDQGEQGEVKQDEYLAIKSTLIKGAMTGDPKYLDLYFKTYGKDFVAEEAAARTSDLAGLEMEELILLAASVLDINTLILFLTENGYEVLPRVQDNE